MNFEPKAALAQIRLLLGNPMQWEQHVSLSWLGRGKVIEDHGNQYRVPNEIARLYKILNSRLLSEQECFHQLEEIVQHADHSSKLPIEQLYVKIKSILNAHNMPYGMPGMGSRQFRH
ncbi:MAG: hypothetical protein K0Q57_480 [Gammaproteobacteria bacterium]|jgi:hypothetical protein|nr:hypothetical protein [Gammaproteobacteria bacterium]